MSLALLSERQPDLNSTSGKSSERARGGEGVEGRGGGGVRSRGGGEVSGEGGVVRGGGVRDGGESDKGRAGGGQDLGLHQCRSCGEDCGSTTGLYRHVAVRCLIQLGESMDEFRRKHRLKCDQQRYLRQVEERRAQVSESSHSRRISPICCHSRLKVTTPYIRTRPYSWELIL